MAFAPVSPLTLDGLPKFLSMTYHRYIDCASYTFAELGIADRLIHAELDRGFTIEEIIGEDQQQWNSQLLYRVLRTCVYAGLVESVNDDKHFILTQSGMMMTSDHPSHVRDHVRLTFGPIITGASQQLPDLVRGVGTGTGVARISGGSDIYTLMGQPDQKEFLSIFSGAMTTFSAQASTKLVTGVDFGRFNSIADLGGNTGAFLAQVLEIYPTIQHGIVFDLPHIINQYNNGEKFNSHKIPQHKWSYVFGNLFDSSTIPPADAYVIKQVLHNFNDEDCLEILSSIRQAIEKKEKGSSTTLFIVDIIILPDGAISNWQSHAVDMAMAFVFGNARERTQDEFEQLLKKAGFEFKKLYPIEAPASIMEAVFIQ